MTRPLVPRVGGVYLFRWPKGDRVGTVIRVTPSDWVRLRVDARTVLAVPASDLLEEVGPAPKPARPVRRRAG